MDIVDALNQNNANQLILVSVKDLNAFATILLDSRDKAIKQHANEKYISSAKVKELIDIKDTALWSYEKQGLLKPYKIGGAKKYKKSEVIKIIEAGRL